MRDAMTGYRKISRYQLESGTSWFERLWQAFREKLSSGHACIYRASLILFDPTIYAFLHAYTYIRPLSRLHIERTCTRFMHEFPSNWSYVFYCSPWAVRLSMHVTNSFCNLLLWKRFGCCYNRCMIFWLGNSEQIVRGIVSQYRQIVNFFYQSELLVKIVS